MSLETEKPRLTLLRGGKTGPRSVLSPRPTVLDGLTKLDAVEQAAINVGNSSMVSRCGQLWDLDDFRAACAEYARLARTFYGK